MRRALEEVVLAIHLAALDRGNLSTNADHRFDEAIQLHLRFTLSRLDHHRAGHREGHCRGMETVVHQPLRDILHFHARRALHRARIENAFVRHEAVLATIQHRIMRLEFLRDVVGAQNGQFCRQRHTFATHQADVRERDGQDARTAPRCGRHRSDRRGASRWNDGMTGKKRHQLRRHANGSHARTAATMRYAKGFVQVEMAHVGAQIARPRNTHHGVHVRTIHVHLPTVLMHDGGDLLDARFKHAVGRRIGHHERAKIAPTRLGLGPQIVHVNVALSIGLHDHHGKTGHYRTGGIRSMRRLGNQADGAMVLVARVVICANHE